MKGFPHRGDVGTISTANSITPYLKFSTVFGTALPYNPIITLPMFSPSMLTSKKTRLVTYDKEGELVALIQ